MKPEKQVISTTERVREEICPDNENEEVSDEELQKISGGVTLQGDYPASSNLHASNIEINYLRKKE